MATERDPMSIRGLQEGEGRTPLRKFYGNLDSYISRPAKTYEGTVVDLNFADVEVIQSTEPYNFPIAIIPVALSNRVSSRWGVFSNSLSACIPPEEDLKHQVGKRIGMVFSDGLDGRPEPHSLYSGRTKREEPTACWEVFEVAGVVAGAEVTSPKERAKRLLVGKTLAEFNAVAFQDPILRMPQNADLLRSVISKTFAKALVQAGEAAVDASGVYHEPDNPF